MKFYISSAFMNTAEIVEIAKAADELGYDGIGIPDHVVNVQTLDTPTRTPRTGNGVGSLSPTGPTLGPRRRAGTGHHPAAVRHHRLHTGDAQPYSAAKAIGTAAVLASGRVELGVGVGWCREEFALMGEQFAARGKRTDEILDLMRALWAPGWTEFDGEFYQTPRLAMQPTPPPIPVYVGGLSDIALRRAARHDGWIGDLIKTDRAIEAVGRLHELRLENGLSLDDFTILTPLTDAFTIADYQRAADAGITGIITMPWMFYAGPDARLPEKIDGMARFRKDLALD